jgi:hypothetical protein
LISIVLPELHHFVGGSVTGTDPVPHQIPRLDPDPSIFGMQFQMLTQKEFKEQKLKDKTSQKQI